VDNELGVAQLGALGKRLHLADLNASLEFGSLDVGQLRSGQQQISLLAHAEAVVLQHVARKHDVFVGFQLVHDFDLVLEVQVVRTNWDRLHLL